MDREYQKYKFVEHAEEWGSFWAVVVECWRYKVPRSRNAILQLNYNQGRTPNSVWEPYCDLSPVFMVVIVNVMEL